MPETDIDLFTPGGALDVYAEVKAAQNSTALVGRILGQYRLTSFIAAGGMSQVYRASRADQQFEREVAVKISSQTILDESYSSRFLAEQQMLASLNHPNIAQLYDVGVSSEGWPYIVMELVDGEPIDEYAWKHPLSVDTLTVMLIQIAEAIAYAHNNLVVHRDIKPSNVIVDGNGTPKLLDFGIAKQIGDTQATLTQGQTPLTPRFASPEQLLNKPISVASDVYQLGALAVSLLADEPWGAASFEEAATLALTDRSEPLPKALRASLPKDLALILTTALQVDPQLRYASATEFAADLKNFRAGFPIQARPTTWNYRLDRFVRRNYWSVGIAVTALIFIVAGSTWYTYSLAASRSETLRSAQQTEAINEFLLDMFNRVSPAQGGAVNLTARELLNQSLGDIDDMSDQPNIQSGLQHAIGQVYLALGETDQAETLIERSLATRRQLVPQSVDDIAQSQMSLGVVAFNHGEFDEALQHYEDARSLLLTKYNNADAEMIRPHHLMGNAYIRKGDLDRAEEVIRETLALRRQHLPTYHREIGISLDVLALVSTWQGDLEEAGQLFRQAHEQFEQSNSELTAAYAGSLDNYGRMLGDMGEYEASLKYHLLANQTFTELYGKDHPNLAQSHNRIAIAYQKQGNFPASIRSANLAIEMYRKLGETPSFMILAPLMTLADAYVGTGEYEKAVVAGEEALIHAHSGFGDDHWRIGSFETKLGGYYHAARRLQDAQFALEKGLRLVQASGMKRTTVEVHSLHALGKFLVEERSPESGRSLIEQALVLAREVAPEAAVTLELEQLVAEEAGP